MIHRASFLYAKRHLYFGSNVHANKRKRRQAGKQLDKPCDDTAQHSSVMYSTSNLMYNYYTRARKFAVQSNGFMSLTSYFDVKYIY